MPRYSTCSPSHRSPCQNSVCTSSGPHIYHMTSPFHSFLFDHLNDFLLGLQISSLLRRQTD
jgi:hypothetical protein